MSDLELLRRAFATVADAEPAVVAAARSKLLAEISALERRPGLGRRHRRFRFAVALAVVAAGTLLAASLVVPRGKALTGEQIAAATRRAVAPRPGVIRHVVVDIRDETPRRDEVVTRTRSRSEQWVASGPPYHIRSTWMDVDGRPWYRWRETETTRCGTIDYFRGANLVTVNTLRTPERELRRLSDPARQFRFGSGRILSRGKTTFRGIPAYWLVQIGRDSTFVYVVRRDNYFPLRTTWRNRRTGRSSVWTFTIEQLPRSAATERVLHVAPRPNAFLLRTSPLAHSDCRLFGTYSRLTGRGTRP